MTTLFIKLLFINYCNVKAGHRKEDAEVATASFMQLQTLFVVLALLINMALFLPFHLPDPIFWGSILLLAGLSFWLRKWYLKSIYKYDFHHRFRKLPRTKKTLNNVYGYLLYLTSFVIALSPLLLIKIVGL